MLKDLTPEKYKCPPFGACPAVFISDTLQNITPEAYRCIIGACPMVFVKKEITDITPDEFRCAVGPCPAVFLDKKLIYLVGKKVDCLKDAELASIPVGNNEALVSLPLDFLRAVKFP